MKVSYSKEQRDRAKSEGRYLVCVDIDGRPAKDWCQTTFTTLDKAEANELRLLVDSFMSAIRNKHKAAKGLPQS